MKQPISSIIFLTILPRIYEENLNFEYIVKLTRKITTKYCIPIKFTADDYHPIGDWNVHCTLHSMKFHSLKQTRILLWKPWPDYCASLSPENNAIEKWTFDSVSSASTRIIFPALSCRRWRVPPGDIVPGIQQDVVHCVSGIATLWLYKMGVHLNSQRTISKTSVCFVTYPDLVANKFWRFRISMFPGGVASLKPSVYVR